jgi:hypothetical protein
LVQPPASRTGEAEVPETPTRPSQDEMSLSVGAPSAVSRFKDVRRDSIEHLSRTRPPKPELARRCRRQVIDLPFMTNDPAPLYGGTPPAYKDRRTGLVIFGIVEIILGGWAVLLVGLMVLGQVMMSRNTGEPPQLRMILPNVAVYGMMAILLVTLGIGSLGARRWARALSLVLSWAWLVAGIFGVGAMAFLLPKMLRTTAGAGPGLPPPARAAIIVVALSVAGVGFVLIPALMVLFYQSRHVKATCEARDPHVRWTDACPLPVLGLSLWLGLSAAYMLIMPFFVNGVFPFFGVLLSGWSGSLAYFVLAGLWIYSAFAAYQLEPAGWWLVLVSFCLMSISAVLTFSHVEFAELYRQMGYSPAQVQMMTQFNFIGASHIGYLSAVGAVPALLYMLWVKHFFHPAAPHLPEPPPPLQA